MKAASFEYQLAGSAEEAVHLLTEVGDEAKLLAGGQSLVPMMAMRLARPACLIDVGRLGTSDGLGAVRVDGDTLIVGALTSQAAALRSDLVRDGCPLMTEALPLIGHFQIRNRGTIGGSLAHADPAAELPTVAVALDAELVTLSPRGVRVIPAADFFVSFLTTALEPDEMLVEVRFPLSQPRVGSSFLELSRRAGDFAVCAVASTVCLDASGIVVGAKIAFGGMAGRPVRAFDAEKALAGHPPGVDSFAAAAEVAVSGLEPPADLHGSSEYRRHVGKVLVQRSLRAAVERAEMR
jgi:carbon-monoxide dehydrogenase medium subunit